MWLAGHEVKCPEFGGVQLNSFLGNAGETNMAVNLE